MNLAVDVSPSAGSVGSQVRRKPRGLVTTTTRAVRAAARFAYDLLNDLF
jgi:hypothetical protein